MVLGEREKGTWKCEPGAKEEETWGWNKDLEVPCVCACTMGADEVKGPRK